MFYYGIRAKSKDMLLHLVTKASDSGDLYKAIQMKKSYSDWGESSTYVCLQYLEGKNLIQVEPKDDFYLIRLTAEAVDFAEPT